MNQAMKIGILYILMAWLLILLGCSSVDAPKARPNSEYGLTPNREAQMDAMVKQLTAKGYSEERAKRIAAKRVPLVQEQSSESLVDVFTGAAAKKEVEDKKFKEDLDKLRKDRT